MRSIMLQFRGWTVKATDHTASAAKGNQQFKLTGQACFEEALRAVKEAVDRLEGPEKWIEGYTNEALL